jgi:hypothetical protein
MRLQPPPDKEKVTIKFDFDEDTLMGEAGVSAAEGETPRASKPRVPRKRETRTWMIGMRTNAPNIRKEVDAAWSKLSKSAKNKNT